MLVAITLALSLSLGLGHQCSHPLAKKGKANLCPPSKNQKREEKDTVNKTTTLKGYERMQFLQTGSPPVCVHAIEHPIHPAIKEESKNPTLTNTHM